MTRDDLGMGLSTLKMYWPQWKDRLEKPGGEAVIMRFWLGVKDFNLRAFEEAMTNWLETRNTVPTIRSILELTETCFQAWKRGQQMEAEGRNRGPATLQKVADRSAEDLAWARFHCEIIERGLMLRTAVNQRLLSHLYLQLAERLPIFYEACERESYECLKLAQELEAHPERGYVPVTRTSVMSHVGDAEVFPDVKEGQEEFGITDLSGAT